MKSISNNAQYYIVDVDNPQERLEFQFIPNELKHSRTANNAKVDIVGRNHPKRHYLGGDDSISFQLNFHATENDIDSVKKSVFWLQGLATGKNVKLVWGNLYQNTVWVVDSVDTVWQNQDLSRGLPEIATVDIKLSVNPLKSITAQQISNGNY